ncbi:hypothetical protein CEXT_765831 [Caerostris extrusa]|uniref:Uncharacterized protein n=1 Tax=Caerostris extrusa TaxID=172846 RepID=A0AAV4XB80_CAEEX|nr:hypothetical protein CEXT_765831 [Caerostris extrusa]
MWFDTKSSMRKVFLPRCSQNIRKPESLSLLLGLEDVWDSILGVMLNPNYDSIKKFEIFSVVCLRSLTLMYLTAVGHRYRRVIAMGGRTDFSSMEGSRRCLLQTRSADE